MTLNFKQTDKMFIQKNLFSSFSPKSLFEICTTFIFYEIAFSFRIKEV